LPDPGPVTSIDPAPEKSRRQILHQRIAEALRDKFAGVVEAEPELIAEHYTRAGLTEPAIVHWGKAGDLALRRSAFKEAIAHLGKAIEMTAAGTGAGTGEKEGAGAKLKLQVSYGNALIAGRGHGAPETTAAFARAREIADQDGRAPERFSVAYGLWVGSYVRADLSEMRRIVDAFLRDVEARGPAPEVGIGHRIAGVTDWCAGDFVQSSGHYEKALANFDPARDGDLAFRFGQDVGGAAMVYQALTLWPLGEVARRSRGNRKDA